MEENNKIQEEPKKLTYEELSAKFNDLWQQYEKLVGLHRQALAQLNDQSFNVMSFYLNMLFKVMEHPNRYPEKFLNWTSRNIQSMMHSLEESLVPPQEPQKTEAKEEPKEEKGEA